MSRRDLTTARLLVERGTEDGGDYSETWVTVAGRVERGTAGRSMGDPDNCYPPVGRGVDLAVVDPPGFRLTEREREAAEAAVLAETEYE